MTNELIAYAKFFYTQIRPGALSPQILAFFQEIDRDQNYAKVCEFIGLYNTLASPSRRSGFTFMTGEFPANYEIYEPVIQLGGGTTVELNTFDFLSVMANEYYDFFYDLEHLRCIDNLPDFTTYTKRYEEALKNTDEFLKTFKDPFDVARGRAFKQTIETQYNVITGRKNNRNQTRKNIIDNLKSVSNEIKPIEKADFLNLFQMEDNPIAIGGTYRTKQTRRLKRV